MRKAAAAAEEQQKRSEQTMQKIYLLIDYIAKFLAETSNKTINSTDVMRYFDIAARAIYADVEPPNFDEWIRLNATPAIKPASEKDLEELNQQLRNTIQQQSVLLDSAHSENNRLTQLTLASQQHQEALKQEMGLKEQLLKQHQEEAAAKQHQQEEQMRQEAAAKQHQQEEQMSVEQQENNQPSFSTQDISRIVTNFILLAYIFTDTQLNSDLQTHVDLINSHDEDHVTVSELIFVNFYNNLLSAVDPQKNPIFVNLKNELGNVVENYNKIKQYYVLLSRDKMPGTKTYHNYLADMYLFFIVITSKAIDSNSIPDAPIRATKECTVKTPLLTELETRNANLNSVFYASFINLITPRIQ